MKVSYAKTSSIIVKVNSKEIQVVLQSELGSDCKDVELVEQSGQGSTR